MASAPDPITSPPPVRGQPYDASVQGPADASQSEPVQVYDAGGGHASADPWPKVQAGGAADWRTGHVTNKWPGNGTSSEGPWKQT